MIKKITKKRMDNGKIKKIIKFIKLKTVPRDKETPVVPGRRRVRCGNCEGCQVPNDCGKCVFCR